MTSERDRASRHASLLHSLQLFLAFETWDAGWRDHYRVPKPKVVALHVFTGMAFVGLTLWLLSMRGA